MNTQLVITEAKQFKQPVSTGEIRARVRNQLLDTASCSPTDLGLPAADHSPTAPLLQMQPSSELCRKSICQFLNTFFFLKKGFQPHQELRNFHVKGKNAHPRQKVLSKRLMFLLQSPVALQTVKHKTVKKIPALPSISACCSPSIDAHYRKPETIQALQAPQNESCQTVTSRQLFAAIQMH